MATIGEKSMRPTGGITRLNKERYGSVIVPRVLYQLWYLNSGTQDSNTYKKMRKIYTSTINDSINLIIASEL